MRSRTTITALLASGALLSSGGAALGVSALTTTDDASLAQYGPAKTTTEETSTVPLSGETLGGSGGRAPTGGGAIPTGSGGGGAQSASEEGTPSSGTKGATYNSTPAAAKVQPARQVSAGADELPFTGYAAIPLLLLGLALLVCGLVLRRRTGYPLVN